MIERTTTRPRLSDLIGELEREASDWTAVESFSSWHQDTHALAGRYEGLVPLSAPKEGERYAFEVDLDKCSACKACVAACHSLNGLDEGESWRAVGALLEPESGRKLVVTSSCHHCDEPGCSDGCPTLAYEKRPDGIVRHLDDQCMGCRYCEWTCPYGAPKWSEARGIVRKCDLCHQRLAVGEAPACVQGCPNGAIAVRILPRGTEPSLRLGGAVEPERTRPASVYRSSRGELSGMVPGHEGAEHPEESHAPLAFLLVATQWAVGAAVLLALRSAAGCAPVAAAPLTAFLLVAAGLGVGTLHLGRPDRAWRAALGWRKSWFSREVIAFGAAAGAFSAWAARPFLPSLPVPIPTDSVLSAAAALLGMVGVYCSARIYLATPRPFWNRSATAWRFALCALGGGAVLAGSFGGEWIRMFGILSIAKALLVRRDARLPKSGHVLSGSARLLAGPLAGPVRLQALLFAAAVLAALAGTVVAHPAPFVLAALLRFGSDLVERLLFFRAALPARMPGDVLA